MSKILLAVTLIAVIVVVALLIFKGQPPGGRLQSNLKIDYSKEYPESQANINGFEKQKTSPNFVAYYHKGDEINAGKTLAVLQQAGFPLYQRYLLAGTNDTFHTYLAGSSQEFLDLSTFPGNKGSAEAGSAAAGLPDRIYLYKPFEAENKGPGIASVIIHEGAHAVSTSLAELNSGKDFPAFLNEGIAHHIEYIFRSGSEYNPIKDSYFGDTLTSAVKTGNPKLLSIDELAQKCEGQLADQETLRMLCRGQGGFIVWYINKNYGETSMGKFLLDLSKTHDWRLSLQNITGKTVSQLGQEVQNKLEEVIKR